MSIALADPSLVINNEPIAIVPNSLKFKEGLGEQTMRAASVGGGSVEQVFSDNIETKFGGFTCEIYPDVRGINKAREWKINGNKNVAVITGKTSDGQVLRRTFNKAALLGDYETPLGADTTIELEFSSNTAV